MGLDEITLLTDFESGRQTPCMQARVAVAQPPGSPLCAGVAHNGVEAPSAVLRAEETVIKS